MTVLFTLYTEIEHINMNKKIVSEETKSKLWKYVCMQKYKTNIINHKKFSLTIQIVHTSKKPSN